MKKSIAFILTFIFVFSQMVYIGHAEGEEVLVITNSGVAQSEISAKDLGNMFLGKKSSWEGGMKAVPVTLESGDTHEKFLKLYIKKSSSQFSTFWKQAVFTGQGIPPKSVSSEADVVKFVSENPGAVGYILPSTPHDGVKILAVK
ncbi:MAG TPA: phosphate ABC transporter substrate-binding protein [Candidatus Rifleibacterium sp.]|jgi:ABC-type phosphate transport system substrate-binding protein|nr:phosphate ABC transporter substrate-binding protein [Candidatus Rifleibacterium sp.]